MSAISARPTSSIICANNLCYINDNGRVLFNNLNFCLTFSKQLNQQIIGLVGLNGVGKSLLMAMITKQLNPISGEINANQPFEFVPQNISDVYRSSNVSQALGLESVLLALKNVEQSQATSEDFELLEDKWNLLPNIEKHCWQLNLAFNLSAPFSNLSGGEQTKWLLIKAIISQQSLIILDEPSNHLDQSSKQQFMKLLVNSNKSVLLVSHDAYCLNQCHSLYELTKEQLINHGPGFEHYLAQRNTRLKNHQQSLNNASAQLKSSQKTKKQQIEQHQSQSKKGKHKAKNRNLSPIEINAAKQSATSSQKVTARQSAKKIGQHQQQVKELLDSKEQTGDIILPSANLFKNHQILLTVEDLFFGYKQSLNKKPINLTVTGSQQTKTRLHIKGDNGSGKSTLVKTLLGNLPAISGNVISKQPIGFIDQHAKMLNPALTAIENFEHYCPNKNQHEYIQALVWLNFNSDNIKIKTEQLSGGERLKLMLACIAYAPVPAELLILDEPNNHLDINALQTLITFLQQYQGALILICHDQWFVDQVGIEQVIDLSEE